MLEDPSAKTTIEEGKKSTAVSGDVIAVENSKAKEEENEKKSEKAKDETEIAVTTNIENGSYSSAAATDSCTSDVSDMRICDAAAAGVISAHPPEPGESMPPSSDPDSDVITRRDCTASNMSSEARGVITSALSEQVTIDLTQETAESRDTTIIDLTAESTTADTGGTGTATAGLIIDLTTDPADDSAVSKSSAKSRRSKRAPLAVYVPPRGRGPPPPPASGATAPPKKTSAAESVLVPAPPPPSVVATEDAPGVDVTEQVIQAFPCKLWPGQCV